ncbi:MAG: PH domain-containing protein [Patescibacteria group bacterium]|nr:PH domain-containing protein [Patescibacteria group bacterium]
MRRLFPSQQEEEKVFLVIREHWFHLFLKIVVWLMFVAALLAFNKYTPEYVPALLEGTMGAVTRLFTQVYTLFLTLSIFVIWLSYYLNMQIITDRRIVDVDQAGLFSHTVSELHIENIEDVTSETKGLFGTLFNYGMVYVQTAASVERFEFDNVPNPAAIEKLILDLYEKNPHGGLHKA